MLLLMRPSIAIFDAEGTTRQQYYLNSLEQKPSSTQGKIALLHKTQQSKSLTVGSSLFVFFCSVP